jgi:hypothetical protein
MIAISAVFRGSYKLLLPQAVEYERAANFFIFSIFNDLIFLK